MEVEDVKMGRSLSDQMMDVVDQVGLLRRPWLCNVY